MKNWLWFISLLAIAVLSATVASPQTKENETAEIWGGPDVQMALSADGATLEFDCAHGVIQQAVKPNAKGEFSAAGTYTPERGGPIMRDNPPRDLAAVYKGTIQGDTMQLEAVISDKDRQPQPFTLTRGQPGRVRKCR